LEDKVLETIVDLLKDKQRANFLFAAFYAASSFSLESCPSRVSGLHLAAFFGLPLTLTALFTKMEEKKGLERRLVLDRGDSFARTPLFLAVSRGNTEIIQILLSNRINVIGRSLMESHWHESSKWWYPTWARDDYSAEALEIAAEEGHKDIVALLLEHGAKPGGDAGVYGGALEAAVFKGHEEIVQLLLEAGASIQATVLQSAVYSGNIKIMRYLLISMLEQAKHEGPQDTAGIVDHPNRIDPEDEKLSPTSRIQLALYAASLAGRTSIAKLLFEYGADVDAETEGFHCTVLAAACAHGHEEIILMFLEEGADVNKILPEQKAEPPNGRFILTGKERWRLRRGGSESGRHGTALQAAAYAGNAATVELLLLHGANPNAVGGYHGTALQAAAFGGSLEVVEALLEHGAELNTSLGVYGNPLQAALLNGSGAIVEKLLNAGADADAEGGRWAYPIIAAAQMGIVSNLRLLLDANADVNATSEINGTALYAAITAQPVLETTRPASPLSWQESPTNEFDDFVAFAQRRLAVARYQMPQIFGRFLTFAAKEIFLDNDSLPQPNATVDSQGLLDCVKLLLEAKADPNVKGGEYGTAFLGAVACGNLKVVNLFIQAGTDVSFQLAREEDPSSCLNEEESKGRSGDESESQSSREWTGHRKDQSEGRSNYLQRHLEPGTPLAMAIRDGKLDIIRALIDAGANPNEESYPYGDSLLHHCGSADAIQLLIGEGAEVERPNR
jgi:ankyrin repeat protein